MGVIHWLDDRIDAFEDRAGCNDPNRALGRRRLKAAQRQAERTARVNPRPEPVPWTPKMGPLAPLRGLGRPTVRVGGAASVVAYVVVFAFRDDDSILGILAGSAFFVSFMLMIGRPRFSHGLDVATPVPPDVPVASVTPGWVRPALGSLAILGVLFLEVILDWPGGSFVLPALLLVGALTEGIRGRTIARWEDEHAVEFLRARDSNDLYVRSRLPAISDLGAQGER